MADYQSSQGSPVKLEDKQDNDSNQVQENNFIHFESREVYSKRVDYSSGNNSSNDEETPPAYRPVKIIFKSNGRHFKAKRSRNRQ